jgi:hypothetical protein
MNVYHCCTALLIAVLSPTHALLATQLPEIKSKPNTAITYTLNGGRLADNLQSFSQAFWLSYLHGIDFLVQPFEYAEHLKAYYAYEQYTPALDSKYNQKVLVNGYHKSLPEKVKDSCLYVSTFEEFPGTNWQDEGFVKALCACIAPVHKLEYPALPANAHSIAIHVRRGGGFHHDNNARRYRPHHFPIFGYYIHALKSLLCYVEGPCYVYLFTDDPEPAALVETMVTCCTPEEQARITIDYRRTGNRHDAHVIEDFFDMMRYTYLIRPFSGYSCFVERLGNCKMAITSTKAQAGSPWGIVQEVTITTYTDRDVQKTPVQTIRVPYTSIVQKELVSLFRRSIY